MTTTAPRPAAPPRVLLVDPDIDELASLAADLRERGVQVALANGTSMACERAKTARVDVIVAANELAQGGVEGLSLLDALAIELGQLPPVLLLVRDPATQVKGESVVPATRGTSRQMKRSPRLRMSAPGSSPDSTRIWKPLQTPRTRPPSCANLRTAFMTGENLAMAPQRR